MRSHIVNQRQRRLYQPPVEPHMSAPGTAAPLGLRIGQGKTTRRTPQHPSNAPEPPRQQAFGPILQPDANHVTRVCFVGNMDAQRIAPPLHVNEQGGTNIKRQGSAEITDARQGFCGCHGLRYPSLHARPGAFQPVALLYHIAVDFRTWRPAWGMDANLIRRHRQPERAATARTTQLIGNGRVADLQDAAIGF